VNRGALILRIFKRKTNLEPQIEEGVEFYSNLCTLRQRRPTLAFAATGWREAREPWLREDLQALISEGVPLCDAESVLSIRQATVEEDAA
jgi:hypothetical protein